MLLGSVTEMRFKIAIKGAQTGKSRFLRTAQYTELTALQQITGLLKAVEIDVVCKVHPDRFFKNEGKVVGVIAKGGGKTLQVAGALKI